MVSIKDLLEEAEYLAKLQSNYEQMRATHRKSVLAALMEATGDMIDKLVEILRLTERKDED